MEEILLRISALERKRLEGERIFQSIRKSLALEKLDISVVRASPKPGEINEKIHYATEIGAPTIPDVEEQVAELLVQLTAMVSDCIDILLDSRGISSAKGDSEFRELKPRSLELLMALINDSTCEENKKLSANSAYQKVKESEIALEQNRPPALRILPIVLAIEEVEVLVYENARLLRKRVSVVVENGILKFGSLEVSSVESVGGGALYRFSLEIGSKRLPGDFLTLIEGAFELVDISTVAARYELGFELDGTRYRFGVVDVH